MGVMAMILPDMQQTLPLRTLRISSVVAVVLRNDGTAESWGITSYGGGASFTNVKDINCGYYACIAVKNDGTAETFGHTMFGGDSSSVTLTNVASTMCGGSACAVLRNDGTGETWGASAWGAGVQLTNIKMC